FAVLFGPAMWLQRRRFGMVRPLRLVAVAMICVYTMTLAGLTVAPAYDVAVTCRNRVGGVLRADPFHTVAETLGLYRGGAGWLELATSFPVLQVAMNMALFLPLGLILRGVFRLDTTTPLALPVRPSGVIEGSQYTGAWGVRRCGVGSRRTGGGIARAFGGGRRGRGAAAGAGDGGPGVGADRGDPGHGRVGAASLRGADRRDRGPARQFAGRLDRGAGRAGALPARGAAVHTGGEAGRAPRGVQPLE